MKSVYSLTVAPNLLAGAVAVTSAVSAVALLYAAADYADKAEQCAFELKAIVINGKSYPALKASSASDYDYTVNNEGTLTFDVQASYHSITAGSTATADGVSAIIETAAKLQSLWDKIAAGINTVHNYVSAVPQLTNRPKTVAELTTPLNVETDEAENLTLSIVSGNVSAEKSAEKTFRFTTSEKEDVEFKFKINASGIESETFSALLEVTNPDENLWRLTRDEVTITRKSGDIDFYTTDMPDTEYEYTLVDRKIYHAPSGQLFWEEKEEPVYEWGENTIIADRTYKLTVLSDTSFFTACIEEYRPEFTTHPDMITKHVLIQYYEKK